MFCGNGSFTRMDDDGGGESPAPESRKKGGGRGRCSSGKSKNPYSNQGLDKFSTVLAELEGRREKILAKMGPQGVAAVRFTYSSAHDKWVPILIKAPRRSVDEEQAPDNSAKKDAPMMLIPQLLQPEPAPLPRDDSKADQAKEAKASTCMKVGKRWTWRACYFWPASTVVILLSLVFFGRAFSICCISMWWYLAPALSLNQASNRSRSGGRRNRNPSRMSTMSKKRLGRMESDKRLLAAGHSCCSLAAQPPQQQHKNVGGGGGGASEVASPTKHPAAAQHHQGNHVKRG